MIGRKNKKEDHISTVRSETKRVRDHNQPVCHLLARAMDVQQLQTLKGISR